MIEGVRSRCQPSHLHRVRQGARCEGATEPTVALRLGLWARSRLMRCASRPEVRSAPPKVLEPVGLVAMKVAGAEVGWPVFWLPPLGKNLSAAAARHLVPHPYLGAGPRHDARHSGKGPVRPHRNVVESEHPLQAGERTKSIRRFQVTRSPHPLGLNRRPLTSRPPMGQRVYLTR